MHGTASLYYKHILKDSLKIHEPSSIRFRQNWGKIEFSYISLATLVASQKLLTNNIRNIIRPECTRLKTIFSIRLQICSSVRDACSITRKRSELYFDDGSFVCVVRNTRVLLTDHEQNNLRGIQAIIWYLKIK